MATTTLISNLTGWGCCSLCDDIGLVTPEYLEQWSGHTYHAWAIPSGLCERGHRHQERLAPNPRVPAVPAGAPIVEVAV
jgi:hypothetical protein